MRTRLAHPGDAAAIADIYNAAVETPLNFDLRARSIEEQSTWLQERSGAYAAVVAIDDDTDEVIGFGSLSPYRTRPAYATTVEDSVYVRIDQRGRGVGRFLLDHLLDVARQHGFHSIIARVVGGNDPSIALHRAAGFELVGVERQVGRKFRRWLDVVELQLLLTAVDPDD